MLWKCCSQYASKFGKLSSGHRTGKGQFSFQCQRMFKLPHNAFISWHPRRRQWHPTPVLLPGESHRRRSLVGCSPWGREESDTTEQLHFHFPVSCIGEGNGNPLQCSCLENPRDGGAWWAAVYGVAQSQTRLTQLSSIGKTYWDCSCKIVSIFWKTHSTVNTYYLGSFRKLSNQSWSIISSLTHSSLDAPVFFIVKLLSCCNKWHTHLFKYRPLSEVSD